MKMRATSFFNDSSIEFNYIEQLKNEIIHSDKLAEHNLNEVKFILIDGSFMPDKLLFANILRNELTKVYQDNNRLIQSSLKNQGIFHEP